MENFQMTYTILASDMDTSYHITPNAIMTYFQDCFARFLSSRRVAAFDIVKQNLIWVISELELKFKRERPLWSSDITVKVNFKAITSIRMYVDYSICADNGEAFAEGTSTWVIINQETKRPFSPKELLMEAGIVASSTLEHRELPYDNSSKQYLRQVEHCVNVTDLDFNGHVCNRTYMSISMATLPIEFSQTYIPDYIHIKFVRESFFGETLQCRISKGHDLEYWFDIVNEKGKEICDIYTNWKDGREELSQDVSEMVKR